MFKEIKIFIQFTIFCCAFLGAHLLVAYMYNSEEKKISDNINNNNVTKYVNVHESIETLNITPSQKTKNIHELSIEYGLREDMMNAIISSKRNENFSVEEEFKKFIEVSEILTKKKTYIRAYTDVYGKDSIHDLYNTYYAIYKINIK